MLQDQQLVSGWELFALRNHLTFKPDNLLLMRDAYVAGAYCGYSLRLDTVSRKPSSDVSGWPWWLGQSTEFSRVFTRMELRAGKPGKRARSDKDERTIDKRLDPQKAVDLLIPAEAQQAVRGRFFAFERGREIVYEQESIEYDPDYLQFVLGLLKNLIEIYPRVVGLGGEVVPVLHPIAIRYHILQHVADQLIAAIGRDTKKRLAKETSRYLCPHCLVHCGPHRISVSWTGLVTYYGCRICGQSRNLVSSDRYRLVVILDRGLTAEQVNDNETVRINWLRHRNLFDFEEVEIVRATDEDVERFAVQVGNDTDPVRKPLYRKMRCNVSPECGLTENTRRILQRIFGEVVEAKKAGYSET